MYLLIIDSLGFNQSTFSVSATFFCYFSPFRRYKPFAWSSGTDVDVAEVTLLAASSRRDSRGLNDLRAVSSNNGTVSVLRQMTGVL